MAGMIEKVARAIAYQDLNGRLITKEDREQLVEAHWSKSIGQAKAAIEAMREPTGDQIHAATLTAVRENGGIELGIAGMWRAMVDEVLNPKL